MLHNYSWGDNPFQLDEILIEKQEKIPSSFWISRINVFEYLMMLLFVCYLRIFINTMLTMWIVLMKTPWTIYTFSVFLPLMRLYHLNYFVLLIFESVFTKQTNNSLQSYSYRRVFSFYKEMYLPIQRTNATSYL